MSSNGYWIIRRYDPSNEHHVKNEGGAATRLSSGALGFAKSEGHPGKQELSVYNTEVLSRNGFEAANLLANQRQGLALAQCWSHDAVGIKVQSLSDLVSIVTDPYPDGTGPDPTVDVAHELVLISSSLGSSLRKKVITSLAMKFRFLDS